jgi:hypothetical protein
LAATHRPIDAFRERLVAFACELPAVAPAPTLDRGRRAAG